MLRNRRVRLGSGFAIALAILLASASVVQANDYWTLSSGSASFASWNWKCWGGYIWNNGYPSIADTDFLVSPGTCVVNSTPFSGSAWIYVGGSVSTDAFAEAAPFSAASNGSLYITTGGDLEMTSAAGVYAGGIKVGGWSAHQLADGNATLVYGPSNYSGTVTQDGGIVNCLGTSPGNEGYEYIGVNGSETSYYNQSGGINSIGHLVLGGGSSAGYYNLNGGTLSAGTISNPGYGGINFGGGTLMFAANNFSCTSSGALALAAATTSTVNTNGYAGTISGRLSGGGALTVTGGGTLVLSGSNIYTGDTTVNAGTLALGVNNAIPGGTGYGNVVVNTGATLDLAGHNLSINGLNDGGGGGGTVDSTVAGTPTLTVGGNNATSAFSGTIQNTAGTLSLTKVGTGTVTVSGTLSYTGRTTIQGGTLEAVGAGGIGLLASNGGLDIQSGKAVLDYTGLTDPMTLDPIANTLMQQARANGWVIDGTHPIGSTTAAANPLVNALGWTDTVVGGRTLLTVMYTLCGDADLNGVVNGADLNTVLSNYNKTGMYWSQGDFNYDGTVNGADLNMVLSNYNQSVSVGAAVPEPSTLLLAAAGLAGLVAYAWRKRR